MLYVKDRLLFIMSDMQMWSMNVKLKQLARHMVQILNSLSLAQGQDARDHPALLKALPDNKC